MVSFKEVKVSFGSSFKSSSNSSVTIYTRRITVYVFPVLLYYLETTILVATTIERAF